MSTKKYELVSLDTGKKSTLQALSGVGVLLAREGDDARARVRAQRTPSCSTSVLPG